MSTANNGTVIHWFRKGLRLHDNPALIAAINKFDGNYLELRPVFILDSAIAKTMRVGSLRWRFLQQSLEDLDSSLRELGTRLYVIRGTPEDVFKRVFKSWNVKLLTFESDIEPYAIERDERVEDLAMEANVRVIQKVSHTLYDPKKIVATNLGKPPMTYQRFLTVLNMIGEPLMHLPTPTSLPDGCKSTLLEDSSECYDVPTLAELGVSKQDLACTLFPGGEKEGMQRLKAVMGRKEYVHKFEKPKTSPNSLKASTTVLSPYLKFGCISPRLFYYKLKEVLATNSKHTKPPVSLMGQLLWREFYYVVASETPNFDKMVGNKICKQVSWDTNKEFLEAWTHGRTGYPWIDAVMIQLRKEGWIHHLARHAVACFLTRGDLYISWEEGQKVFEELLIDADWALNAGNWMWLSASAFFHQYFRVYSPVTFPKKTDKTGVYVRKYLPVLKHLPTAFIYEPWKAPKEELKKAGIVLGVDYPHRIVIHEDVYKANIARMALAYAAEKVIEVSAKRAQADPAVCSTSSEAKKSKPASPPKTYVNA